MKEKYEHLEKLFKEKNWKPGGEVRMKYPIKLAEDYITERVVTDPEEINKIRETFWRTAIASQELPPSWWKRWTARILRRGRK